MGLGIWAMHYIGMAAIRITPAITYRPGLVLASILIAIAASFAATWIVSTARGAWFAGGDMAAPLVACGLLKIGYDLALFVAFRRVPLRAEMDEG